MRPRLDWKSGFRDYGLAVGMGLLIALFAIAMAALNPDATTLTAIVAAAVVINSFAAVSAIGQARKAAEAASKSADAATRQAKVSQEHSRMTLRPFVGIGMPKANQAPANTQLWEVEVTNFGSLPASININGSVATEKADWTIERSKDAEAGLLASPSSLMPKPESTEGHRWTA